MDYVQLDAHKRDGRFAEALALVDAFLEQVPGDPEALLERGHCSRLMGNFVIAETAYGDAWAEAESIGEPDIALEGMLGLASVYRAMGRYRQALGLLDEAREIAEALEDDESLPHIYWIEGTTLRYSGDLNAASAALQTGLALAEARNDLESTGYLLAALGGLARVRGDVAETAAWYDRAYTVFSELEDAFGLAYTACGRGNAARMQGHFAAAEEHFSEAATRYAQFGDKVSFAYTLWAWATLHKLRGEYAEAGHKLDQAAGLFDETGDRRGGVYVALARLEIEWLTDPAAARATDWQMRAQQSAATWRAEDLPLEAAFADVLLAAAGFGDVSAACDSLAAQGTAWRGEALPLNMP